MRKFIPEYIKKFIDNEELMFKLSTASKFTLLSAFFAWIAIMFTYFLLKIDLIFFQSYGLPIRSDIQEAYYDFIYANLLEQLPYFIFVFFLIFIGSYYVAKIMIRPFKVIGNYCEIRMKNETHFYNPDIFSDLKLLTSFSAFFFAKVDEARAKGKLEKVEIPEVFTNIHKPILEKNFFLNYSLLILIFALVASVGILVLTNEIRDQVILLSSKIVHLNPQAKMFIDKHFEVVDSGITLLLVTHLLVTIFFGFHLYHKVSSPAFAVFATMRSFIKGNYHNRIHLVGFYYLRNDCRKINKYLDHVQKELT